MFQGKGKQQGRGCKMEMNLAKITSESSNVKLDYFIQIAFVATLFLGMSRWCHPEQLLS